MTDLARFVGNVIEFWHLDATPTQVNGYLILTPIGADAFNDGSTTILPDERRVPITDGVIDVWIPPTSTYHGENGWVYHVRPVIRIGSEQQTLTDFYMHMPAGGISLGDVIPLRRYPDGSTIIRGPKGERGPRGERGPAGADGQDGQDGSNVIPADEFIADRIRTSGTESEQAVSDTVSTVAANDVRDAESPIVSAISEKYQPRGTHSRLLADQYRDNASSNVYLNMPAITLHAGVTYKISGQVFIEMDSDDGTALHPGIKFWLGSTDTVSAETPLNWTVKSDNGSAYGTFADTLSLNTGVAFGQFGVIEINGFIEMPVDYSRTIRLGVSKNVARNNGFTVKQGTSLVAEAMPGLEEYFNGRKLAIGNMPSVTLQTPGKPWNFSYENDIMRIELRNGDRWQGDAAENIGTNDRRERCEIAGPKYPNGTDIWFAYDFRYFGNVADLEITPNSYLFISQVLARGVGPVMAAQLNVSDPLDPRFTVSNSYVPRGSTEKVYNTGVNIPLWAEGEMQSFVFHLVTGIDNDAILEVWRNGVKEFESYNTNIGAEHSTELEQPQLKFGQYRGQHNRLITEYANIEAGTVSLIGRV